MTNDAYIDQESLHLTFQESDVLVSFKFVASKPFHLYMTIGAKLREPTEDNSCLYEPVFKNLI